MKLLQKMKTGKFWAWIGGGFILFILFAWGSVEYTSRSEFCKTCHYMKPFYQSWQESEHSDVKCIDCHYPPGLKHKLRGKMEGLVQLVNYVTQAYRRSKPWAEIPDESCLRPGCHEKQLLNGEEEFKGVHFAHKPHLTEMRREKNLRCTSCHSQIVQGEHMLVTATTCYICHFKDGKTHADSIGNCKVCHTDKRMLGNSEKGGLRYDHAPVIERNMNCVHCHGRTIEGNGDVPKEQCYNCHFENERLARFGETGFLHKTHISEHKIECIQCHTPIEHHIVTETVESLTDCKSCHSGTHTAQIDMFAGTGGMGIHDMPSSMLESGLDCRGCHVFHAFSKGMDALQEDTFEAKAQACEDCHGRGFGKLMKQWEKSSEEKVRRLETMVRSVKNEMKRLGKGSMKCESLHAAQFNIELVKLGKSVHNISYADALLNVSYKHLEETLKICGSDMKLPVFSETSTVIPTECASCHVSLQVETVSVFDVGFSHERHVIDHDVLCQKCHSNAISHGQLIITRNECLKCHHSQQEEKTCEDCHKTIATLFKGTTSVFDEVTPDLMFEAELDCYSCHAGDGGEIVRSTSETCLNCHDEGYDTMLLEWQNSTRTALTEISVALGNLDLEALDSQQKKRVSEIRRMTETIRKDGSLSAHNSMGIAELLEVAKTDVEAMSAK